MIYRIQIFYPDAGFFMNTNHESVNFDQLKKLASSDLFSSSCVRIVDESQQVLFEPSVQEITGVPSSSQIADMLGGPIVEPPGIFSSGDKDDKS